MTAPPRSPDGPQSPRAETGAAAPNEALPRLALRELANGRDADGVQHSRKGADRRREPSTPGGRAGQQDGETRHLEVSHRGK